MNRSTIALLLTAALGLAAGMASAASVVWTNVPPSAWDTSSRFWRSGAVSTNYTDGDAVTFNSENYDASCGPITIQAAGVRPGSVTITGQRAPVGWTFSGGDITGTTSIVHDWGNRDMTFTGGDASWNYNFSGGVTLQSTPQSSGATMIYQPGSGGGVDSHYFGSGSIYSYWRNSGFRFNPTDAGDHLANNFVFNGGAWRAPLNGGLLDGTITLAGDVYFYSTSAGSSTTVTNPLILAVNNPVIRHMAPIVGNGFILASPVTSSGGPRDLTLLEDGDNYAWYVFLSDQGGTNPPMGIRHFTLTNTVGRPGTIQINADERTYFTTMRDNGGTMTLASGTSVRFARANTIELSFPMDVRAGNKGFQLNDAITVTNGGILRGNGNFGRSTGAVSTDFSNSVAINIYSGSVMEISSPATCRGPVTVWPNGVLRGSGTLSQNLVVTNGATLSPGISGLGTLSVSNLFLYPSTRLDIDLAYVGGSRTNDIIAVANNLTLDGDVYVTGLPGFKNGSYRIMTYSGTLTDNGLRVQASPPSYSCFVNAHSGYVEISCRPAGTVILVQ